MAQPGGDRPPPEEAPPPHLVEYVPLPRATDVDPANSKTSLNVDGLVRRKNTSFKITNILPSRPPSNDPDESGEDDPDDSRTEDISDNIDEIGFISMRRPSAGILRRGSIPGDLVAGTMFPIAEFGFVGGSSGASTPGQGPVHGPRDRFKVVKIETSAPQKRGRWTCIEYADKNLSALSNTQSSATTNTTTTTTSEPIITSAATATVNTLPSVEPVITTMDSDPTPQLMSPTGPTKGLQHSSEEPEGSSQPMSYAHPDLIVMPTSTVPSLPPGASYSTSPVPYSSHPGSVATSLPSVSQHQQSIPPTAVSSQMPIYTPVSLPVASIVSMSQPMPTYSQSMGMSHTGTMSQHSVVMSQAGATSHTGAISHAGVGSQPVSMSQPVVMSQMIAQQSTSSPVVSIAASSDLVVSTSSQYPIPSQSSIPTSLQGFDALGTSAVQAGSGLQSPSSSQVPTNSSQTFSGPPSSIHQTVSQQSYSTQQQSPMQQQQQQPAQFQTMSQPQFQPIQQSTFHSSQQAMQQQQQQQPIQLPQQPQQTAMPPIMAPSQQQQTTATSQQPMVQQQATVASQQPMVQQQTTSIGQQPMVQQQGTPVGQQPMVQQQATPVGQQTMVQQQGPSVSQQPMVQQQGPSVGQQQMVQQQSTPVGQQSIVQQQSTPVGQQPMVQQQGTPMGQQSMVQQQAAPSSQQPMVQQATSSMSQQPMVQQQASGVSQQQLVQQQTTSVGQQPMVQQQATVPNQQSLVQPATVVQPTPVIQPVVQQTPVIMTSQAPLSVSIGMPMSSADTIYMGSSSGITSTTMTRHVTVGPIPAQSYLAVSSPLVLPTNTASTVSSIPGSRDPVQGGATLTPIVNPAARDPSYNVPPGPFPDSQPVASDLLVERLEEISTQQEMVEDPESASGSNQGAIDNRIEQAMDLVKSHLMNAVRSEVEELKEKIIKLEEIISQLQSENEFLRANVHRDVLLQLQQQQQLQIQQQQSLGSPPTQPALPQTPQLN